MIVISNALVNNTPGHFDFDFDTDLKHRYFFSAKALVTKLIKTHLLCESKLLHT